MKAILCVLSLLVLTVSSADAYVRRTVGGGHVVRGAGAYSGRYYGHPVARGAAVATGAAVAAGAVAAGAATGWGWNQPYYSGYGYGYGGGYGYPGYGGGYANRSYVTGRPTLIPRYYGGAYGAYASYGGVNSNYMKALEESGYDPKNDYTADGNMKAQ